MLKIFNELSPFFEDCYREISVREYAKLTKVSPPTASTILKKYEKEGLLLLDKKGIYYYFRANRTDLFVDFARIYWKLKLTPFVSYLAEKALFANVIIFGSTSKGENTRESDIDIYLDISRKDFDVSFIEKKLKRRVELHFREETTNEHLKVNIEKGIFLHR
ncbi:MAG: nucleotidyltransferase domain-containing protein [Candidatus Nanoarchaeia archaeon]